MNKHTYTPLHSHPLISTIQTHIYTFTLLISTIGRFLDYPHKSTLTAQCTATLDRAIFKTHSDLRQRSTTTLSTIHPPAHAFKKTSGHKLCNVEAVNARHQQRLELDSSAVLSTPSHSTLYNRPEYYNILYLTHVTML